MVQSINKEERTITVSLSGDVSELHNRQQAIIELLRNYDYDSFGNGCKGTVYYALELLSDLLPDEETQTRGFIPSNNYLELPEDLSEKSRTILREAIHMLKYKETTIRHEPNPIFQILNAEN